MSCLDDRIISEITKSLILLGAKSDLLSIIGSWNDTLDDVEILELLKNWNESKRQDMLSTINYLNSTDN